MIGPWLDSTLPVFLPDPVNRHHPLNQGRISWWLVLPPGDGGRQWYDLMGLYHGTLSGVTAASAGWRGPARPGGWGAMELDGTGACLVATPALNVAQPLAIAAWLRVGTAGRRNVIFGRFAAAAFFVESTNKLSMYSGSAVIQGATSLAANRWYHCAVTLAGSVAILYLDGVQDGSGTSGANAIISNFAIGTQYPSTDGCAGQVDGVSLWSRVLTAAEVRADYDLSRAGYPGVLNRVGPAMMPRTVAPTFNPAWTRGSNRFIGAGVF